MTDGYAPSAAGTSSAEFIFVEGLPGHRFFYDLFGELQGAQLLTPYSVDEAWGGDRASKAAMKSSLDYIGRSVGRRAKALFFLTFDPLVYGPSADAFFRFLRDSDVPVLGILHRLPDSPSQMERLRDLNSSVAAICCLSETMAAHVRSTLGLDKARYLPHHPTTFTQSRAARARDKSRAKMGIRPGQVAFAVIGEARRGKGIDLLLSAFRHVPASKRERMFFVFAGKARHHSNDEVRQALVNAGIMGFSDLRRGSGHSHYVVLSEREYAEYIAASDIGLLLYQGEQRNCMSGVLGDFVWANCKLVATADSFTGAEVRKHGLGLVLNEETPSALAAMLVRALELPSAGISPGMKEYRELIAPGAVLETLRQLIDPGDAGHQTQSTGTQRANEQAQEAGHRAA